MKVLRIFAALAVIIMLAQCSSGVKKVSLKTEMDTLSYCIGYSYARSMVEQGHLDSVNVQAIAMAMSDYMSKKKPIMESTQIDMFIRTYMMKRYQNDLTKSLKAASEFLAKNRQEKGVVQTASGLQYIVLKEGSGPKPRIFDTVSVVYRGALVDGTVFDSTTIAHPAKFSLQTVIPGWSEALQLMNAGSKYKLFIPPTLGFGENVPQNSPIKANSVLVFDVELLKIIPGKEPKIMPVKKLKK